LLNIPIGSLGAVSSNLHADKPGVSGEDKESPLFCFIKIPALYLCITSAFSLKNCPFSYRFFRLLRHITESYSSTNMSAYLLLILTTQRIFYSLSPFFYSTCFFHLPFILHTVKIGKEIFRVPHTFKFFTSGERK